MNGDFAYKSGMADYTIESNYSKVKKMERAMGPIEPCILVCQKKTLQLNGRALDVEDLMNIQAQLMV